MSRLYHQLKLPIALHRTLIVAIVLLVLPLSTRQLLADDNISNNNISNGNVTQKTTYRFGVVPQFGQRKLFSIWMPVLQMLEAETGLRFELIGSEQITAFEDKFLAGDFDFSYMNPYHAVVAHRAQRYEPIIRDGNRKLQGILVVKSDSPINSVNELNGKQVAFPSRNALATLLPRAELLREHGVTVKPRYVKTHSSVYIHVAQGLSSAGGGVASTLNQQKPEINKRLRILYRTHDYTPHPIVAHPRVPKHHVKHVQAAFLAMSKREDGQRLLQKIPMLKAIIATIDDYDAIKTLQLHKINDSAFER